MAEDGTQGGRAAPVRQRPDVGPAALVGDGLAKQIVVVGAVDQQDLARSDVAEQAQRVASVVCLALANAPWMKRL